MKPAQVGLGDGSSANTLVRPRHRELSALVLGLSLQNQIEVSLPMITPLHSTQDCFLPMDVIQMKPLILPTGAIQLTPMQQLTEVGPF